MADPVKKSTPEPTSAPVQIVNEKQTKAKKMPSIPSNISSKLLLPMSIVFLAVCLSSSLIVSSLILSKTIKENGLGLSSSTNTTGSTTTTTTTAPVAQASIEDVKNIFKGDYIKFGDENRKVLFVEFSDPSCPFCHLAGGKDPELNAQVGSNFTLVSAGGTYVPPVEEMRKLVDQGKASFAWVYANGHGNGEMGTRALYCANEKGKFWAVHDKLMSNAGYNLLNNDVKNDKSKSQTLADFLNDVIPSADMKSCLDSGKYDSRITSDMSLYNTMTAANADKRGTPTFFINTTPYLGAYNYTDMKATVDAALQ